MRAEGHVPLSPLLVARGSPRAWSPVPSTGPKQRAVLSWAGLSTERPPLAPHPAQLSSPLHPPAWTSGNLPPVTGLPTLPFGPRSPSQDAFSGWVSPHFGPGWQEGRCLSFTQSWLVPALWKLRQGGTLASLPRGREAGGRSPALSRSSFSQRGRRDGLHSFLSHPNLCRSSCPSPMPTWYLVRGREQNPRRMSALLWKATLLWWPPTHLASPLPPRVGEQPVSSDRQEACPQSEELAPVQGFLSEIERRKRPPAWKGQPPTPTACEGQATLQTRSLEGHRPPDLWQHISSLPPPIPPPEQSQAARSGGRARGQATTRGDVQKRAG